MSDAPLRIVTAALPYANGSIHLGHLVEYTQADIYVRALRSLGERAVYLCADDVHGTPIELNATKQGIPPEDFVAKYHQEHTEDFARFGIGFDQFGTTHAESNRALVAKFYQSLKDAGLIEEREIEAMWSEKDGRFLPDRFITGTCPKCSAEDQYGDTCENCGSTYDPTDLINPRSVLSGDTPVPKKTTHLFVKLAGQDFLQKWISGGALSEEQANYVQGWIDKGLQDWCITRDGPYFGFPVPDRPGKFFYVWLDAPIGYVSSTAEWNGTGVEKAWDLWASEDTRIEHIIGKDIVYFHTLFWPTVLKAAGKQLPAKVHVHGMLKVDGKKMSKSRGTFINARTFAEHLEPQTLRYYYATKLSNHADDLDLAFDDFVNRVNTELVNNHANLFSRAAQFVLTRLEGRLGALPFEVDDGKVVGDHACAKLAQQALDLASELEGHYRSLRFSHVTRTLAQIGDIGNEWMQSQKPWDQLKTDPEAARLTCTFALNICELVATYLEPILPEFSSGGSRILGRALQPIHAFKPFTLRDHKMGEMERLFERISMKDVLKVVEASKTEAPKAQAPKKKAKPSDAPSEIGFEDFQKVALKAGKVLEAEKVPKSDRLLKLMIDVGEAQPRQIVSGIAEHFSPESLPGSMVVVVTNLKPAKLRGVESQGMVLATTSGESLHLVSPGSDAEPGDLVS